MKLILLKFFPAESFAGQPALFFKQTQKIRFDRSEL